jgi:Anti-sigma-K factor rskA
MARLDDALARLDSADRALLELSLRRGLGDPELADLMRIEQEQVRHRRDKALDELGDDLGIDQRERLVAALLDQWRNPAPEEETKPERPSRRATVVAVLVVALLGIGAGTLVAVIAEDDEEQTARPSEDAFVLEPVSGAGGAAGQALIRPQGDHARLVMQVEGLPRGTYQVWLYDSATRARPVARFRHDTTRLDLTLPVDPRRYRFLDVSREPADDDPDHSGASVLRAPIERLLES